MKMYGFRKINGEIKNTEFRCDFPGMKSGSGDEELPCGRPRHDVCWSTFPWDKKAKKFKKNTKGTKNEKNCVCPCMGNEVVLD